MAANQYGFSLAEVYKDVESIKGSRTKNRLSELELNDAERLEAERPAREAKMVKLEELRGQSVEGNQEATKQLLVLDAEGQKGFIDSLSKMDETQKKKVQESVLEVAQMNAWVLQSKSEGDAEKRLQYVFSKLPEEQQAAAVEDYKKSGMSPRSYAKFNVAKTADMKTIMANPQVVTMGNQNIMFQNGQEIDRANIPDKSGSGSGGSGGDGDLNLGSGLKSTDESLIYRMSAEIMGGIFDSRTDKLINLDKDARNQVQAISTMAAKIYAKGGITRNEAVSQAANSYGFKIDTTNPGEKVPTQTNYDDPKEIEKILNK